jgi:hypothetical protein
MIDTVRSIFFMFTPQRELTQDDKAKKPEVNRHPISGSARPLAFEVLRDGRAREEMPLV